jgi:hypothetical protein
MPANQAMLDLLVALAAESARPLASGLAELLQGELVEENGCWFLVSLREGARTASLATFSDRTGLECFVNHIHIGDFLETSDVIECLRQGLRWASGLRGKLQEHGRFNVMVSCDDTRCSVRFHRVRPGESWMMDDLESYRAESVLVIPVGT